MPAALLVYIGGVVVGLLATDARPAGRIALAVLWPIGPIAFLATLALLLAASAIAFPLFGLVAVAGAVAWWLL